MIDPRRLFPLLLMPVLPEGQARPTPLHVLSSKATQEVLERLCADHQRSTGQPVHPESIGGVDAARRVRSGEPLEVVVLAAATIDALIAEGHLLEGSRVDLVRSGIAVAVQAGAARPALGSAEQVRAAVLAAPSLSYSTGPSGVYLEQLFTRWGIFDSIRPRIVQAPPGVPAGKLVAQGDAALGFQQYAELIRLPGIDLLGPLPADIQLITTFSAGLSVHCRRPDVARALLRDLAGPQAEAVKRDCGMEGVPQGSGFTAS